MPDIRANGDVSNMVRFKIRKADTGQGLTGLTISSSGLIISTICDNEDTAVDYTAAGSAIETIATLGTFVAPSSNKCRFAEVDATNHPGLYEFQFADARFAVSNAKRIVITVSGVTNLLEADYEIEFSPAASLSLTQLNNIAIVTLRKTMANVEAGGIGDGLSKASLYGKVQQSDKFAVSGNTLNIYKTDGVTLLGTITLTGLAGADPVVAGT